MARYLAVVCLLLVLAHESFQAPTFQNLAKLIEQGEENIFGPIFGALGDRPNNNNNNGRQVIYLPGQTGFPVPPGSAYYSGNPVGYPQYLY